ncbi:MAG: M28 family peptidase [Desulfatitalea sp.]|nr:M28 family peptidase [Desulfatitalea sp.]NNK00804.1 M28 family peptidase [Desulfatitalea sp.]
MNCYLKLFKLAVLFIFSATAYGCANKNYIYPDYDVSAENMKRTVQYLSDITPPRNHLNTESLENASSFIIQELNKYGISAEQQKFMVSGNIYKNVIASVGPKEGVRTVVGAHYDVCEDQPGADDNASAIAGLLETARIAKMHESALPFRVDFVAYTLEEPPYFGTEKMGSYIHAKYLHENNIKLRGMICLEMIGFFNDQKDSQRYPLSLMRLFYGSRGNFISVVSNYGSSSFLKQVSKHLKATAIEVKTLKAPTFFAGIDFSDHRNYWKFGYDAIMVSDTSFYRNPNYHMTSDTIDTLDFNRMKEVVKGICWFLLNIN